LYDAEKQLMVALPKMSGVASEDQLKSIFEDHLQETREHAKRLESLFDQLGKQPLRTDGEAMKGLVAEAEMIIDASGDASVKNAALITAAQRVEHYEIAGYGTARSIADQLGHHQAAQLLKTTLDEENRADRNLSKIAEIWVNLRAAQATL
jgi:ferritin-like metal-binding protein YciE